MRKLIAVLCAVAMIGSSAAQAQRIGTQPPQGQLFHHHRVVRHHYVRRYYYRRPYYNPGAAVGAAIIGGVVACLVFCRHR